MHKFNASQSVLPSTIVRSVEQFLEELQKHQQVLAAYIYGSQVASTATEWSDIDLAVVSPDFGDRFEERLNLMRLAAKIDDRIEPNPYTPEDFDVNDPLVSEIERTGVRVA
jgi:predicted nucleotidyltransferase